MRWSGNTGSTVDPESGLLETRGEGGSGLLPRSEFDKVDDASLLTRKITYLKSISVATLKRLQDMLGETWIERASSLEDLQHKISKETHFQANFITDIEKDKRSYNLMEDCNLQTQTTKSYK